MTAPSSRLKAGPTRSTWSIAPRTGRPAPSRWHPSSGKCSAIAATPATFSSSCPGSQRFAASSAAVEPLADEHECEVHVLHGSLPAEDQDRALRPGAGRKLILATNIAETSLTIDGVTTVIDSGLARIAHHDAQKGFDRLDLTRISQASAAQRAGRAGRTGPGRCIRLWSERQQRGMVPFQPPEVHRVDLCGAVLTLHSWGVRDVAAFGWYDPPAPDRLDAASRLLTSLGALGPSDGRITPLGKQMLDLPVHPRLARLLLASVHEQRSDEGAALAALISEKDIVARGETPGQAAERRRVRAERGRSDLLPRLNMLAEAEHAAVLAPAPETRYRSRRGPPGRPRP